MAMREPVRMDGGAKPMRILEEVDQPVSLSLIDDWTEAVGLNEAISPGIPGRVNGSYGGGGSRSKPSRIAFPAKAIDR